MAQNVWLQPRSRVSCCSASRGAQVIPKCIRMGGQGPLSDPKAHRGMTDLALWQTAALKSRGTIDENMSPNIVMN